MTDSKPSEDGKKAGFSRRLQLCVEHNFYRAFSTWGRIVARRPWTVTIVSLVIALSCLAGFSQFRSVSETDKLWIPQAAQALKDQKVYNSFFGAGFRREKFIAVRRDGGNILNLETILEISRFDAAIRNFTIERAEKEVGFQDVCAPACEGCTQCLIIGHPLELWYKLQGTFDFSGIQDDNDVVTRFDSQRGIDEQLFPANSSRQISLDGLLGGVERDSSGRLVSAKAISWTYFLDGNLTKEEDALAWEDEMVAISRGERPDIWESDIIEVAPQSDEAINQELSAAIRGDLISLNIGLFAIILYATFVLGKAHPLRGHSLLALGGVLSVVIAIGASYGLAFLTGFFSTPVTNVLPFILLGIGVDDMFVLVSAFERSKGKNVEERMADGMGHAGVSITITSVTDLLAFALGSMSRLPALENFCAFAAFGILFDYALQISLFAAMMVWDARRQENRRADCLPCITVPKDKEPITSGCCCGCYNTCNACVSDEGFVRRFIRLRLVQVIFHPVLKWIILLAFFSWFGVAIWGALQLKQDFSFRFFVPSDSPLTYNFDLEDTYFPAVGLPVNVITAGDNDYSLVSTQKKLLALAKDVDACKDCSGDWIQVNSTTSWYSAFLDFVTDCVENPPANITLPPNFVPPPDFELPVNYCAGKYLTDDGYVPEQHFLTWLFEFLNDNPRGGFVSSDVVFEEDEPGSRIAAGRMRALYLNLASADEQVRSMLDLRAICADSGLDGAFPFMFMYSFYEQFAIIESEAIQNLALALLAVAIISVVMLGSLRAAVLVMLCVVMVDASLLGMMFLWGISVDSVAVANIVLAVGLAVDYSMHIAHSFLTNKGTRERRAKDALIEMGTSVLHGGLSTFVAVLILATSKSYIFFVFFQMFFGICFFGLAHGLVMLPILLSVAGPEAHGGPGDSHPEHWVDPYDGKKAEGEGDVEMTGVKPSPRSVSPVGDGADGEATA
eukprot:PLAT13548.1.p1 GENE.PLAT13548.1~~PLAT13548.1.p1  ORF type:complete len:988 (+),score=491.43 PLAT13548.1:88-2964(+)